LTKRFKLQITGRANLSFIVLTVDSIAIPQFSISFALPLVYCSSNISFVLSLFANFYYFSSLRLKSELLDFRQDFYFDGIIVVPIRFSVCLFVCISPSRISVINSSGLYLL